MVSAVEEPSQAERHVAIATANIAGPGATDSAIAGDPLYEKPVNGSSSNSSEAAMEQNALEKAAVAMPEAPQRSASKVALIMGSLCVRQLQSVIGNHRQY